MRTNAVWVTLAIMGMSWFCCGRAGAQESSRNRPNIARPLPAVDDTGFTPTIDGGKLDQWDRVK